MLFNSYIFVLVFLPVVLALWWSPRLGTRGRLTVLVAASYCFYGWWDYRFVGLLVLSTVVDYVVGHRIADCESLAGRRRWLSVSLATNLSLLGFFKYCGFFAASMNAVTEWLRVGGAMPIPDIVLPVGISFYTFQTLSYSIDLYRGKAQPAISFLHFAAYVALFPQLIAGPIVRYGFLEQQLRGLRQRPDWEGMSQGLVFFVAGMVQKVLLADTIAARINPLWADYATLQFAASWYAALGYACQLYFDFAAYSNMAVGLGLLLGFRFPQNFDSPYKSANISEFWRRWHMTLSFWLRDYLFVPLGGSRQGHLLTLRNLMIVMLLGGLWHGAGWTFVLWGGYHGCLLVAHAVYKHRTATPLPRPLGVAITFLAVVLGWVLFRSTDLGMCAAVLWALVGGNGLEADLLRACGGMPAAAVLVTLLLICFWAPNVWQVRVRPSWYSACGLAAVFTVCVLRFSQESPFLYFQF